MKYSIILGVILLFIACDVNSNRKLLQEKIDFEPYHLKIMQGLEQDSLQYYLQQLEKLGTCPMQDSLKAEYWYTHSRFQNRLQQIDSAIADLNKEVAFHDGLATKKWTIS